MIKLEDIQVIVDGVNEILVNIDDLSGDYSVYMLVIGDCVQIKFVNEVLWESEPFPQTIEEIRKEVLSELYSFLKDMSLYFVGLVEVLKNESAGIK